MLDDSAVTLEEMLCAREQRVQIQQKMLSERGNVLICFTLNIAGAYKNSPLITQAFYEGTKWIKQKLKWEDIQIVNFCEHIKKTGCEGYFLVSADAKQIKQFMVEIEESCPLGRLFDIDVLEKSGCSISRSEVGNTARTCLLCAENARVCMRRRTHTTDELMKRSNEMMQDYFHAQFADKVSALAVRSLLYEVTVTPKPGLVDRANNGAHKDMDLFTFIDSATALTPFFREFVRRGLSFTGTPTELFASLKSIGRQAEDVMFEATNGINTHKGLLFSMGIICAAVGYCYQSQKSLDTDNILHVCGEMAKSSLHHLKHNNGQTHGEQIYTQYGFTGIRGEASSGFASVKNHSLPVLTALVKRGYSLNDAGAAALLHLIAHVHDTNIIARSDVKTLTEIQKKANHLLANAQNSEQIISLAKYLDKEFIQRNISAGGSADLLAVTFMLYFLASADDGMHPI